MTEEKPVKRRRHKARKWHRWLGLAAAFPLLWLSITGLLLNHATSLGLDQRMVSTGWILRHYHQLPEGEPAGLQVGDRFISEWGGGIYLDQKLLPLDGTLVSATAFQDKLIIATPEKIGVFDGSDDMLLELDELSLPGIPVTGVLSDNNRLLVQTNDTWHALSEDLFSSEETTTAINSISPGELTADQKPTLEQAIRTRSAMPLSRVILDAHSGSLFGWPGWLITDLAAVGVIILTILGLRLYPKRRT